jgi:hypothetical protein
MQISTLLATLVNRGDAVSRVGLPLAQQVGKAYRPKSTEV